MKQSLTKLASFIADNLSKDNVGDFAKSLHAKLVKTKNLSKLNIILDLAEEEFAKKNNSLRAKIISSRKLSDQEITEISQKLKIKYKKDILPVNQIDSQVVAGIKIKINDEIIDLTWQGKIKKLKSKLAGEI